MEDALGFCLFFEKEIWEARSLSTHLFRRKCVCACGFMCVFCVFVCRLDVLYVGMKVRMRRFVCLWIVCVDVWDKQRIYVSFINILMGYCEILWMSLCLYKCFLFVCLFFLLLMFECVCVSVSVARKVFVPSKLKPFLMSWCII